MSIDTTAITFPQVWEEFDLGSLIANVRESARITKDEKYELWSVPSFSDGKPEYVTGAEIGSGKLLVEKDDVLISKINPRINRVWMVTELKSSGLIQVASPEWLVARVKDHERVLVPFLTFYLSSPVFRDWISSASSSVTGSHSRAKAGQILEQIVPVPPLEEQVKIVEILEEQLARLDAALASVSLVRKKAARFRHSLLYAGLNGRLSGDYSPTGTLKEGWEVKKLSDCVEFSPRIQLERLDSEQTLSFVPMTKVAEVTGQIDIDETISAVEGKRRNLTYFENGDVIFAKITPCMENGKVARAKGLINGAAFGSTEFHVLRPNETIDGDYLHLYLVSDVFRQAAELSMTGAVGQKRVPRNFLESHEISLPPLDEQRRILGILSEQLTRLNASLNAADAIERLASALRRSLLHSAFTGELTKEWREGAHV